jgi:ribosomal-protein-serine acetyltransferase
VPVETHTDVCRIGLDDGLWLRLLTAADAPELHALIEVNREHLARWMPWAAGQTFEDTVSFIARTRQQLNANEGFQVAVVEQGEIVGVIGFHSVLWGQRSTSMGYWLAAPAQGRGIMTRAVNALVQHAFETWRLERVEIRAATANTRSRAVPERLGFVEEGVVQGAERVGDRLLDQAVYGILADDWLGRDG